MNIGIDVTPILPGGACGGVKQLIIELLRGFAKKNSPDRFILLTAYYNEDIFREFEQYGMKQIPIIAQNSQGQPGQQNCSILNQQFYGDVLRKNGVNALFCPMTDPINHEPGIPTVSLICDLQHFYYPLFFEEQELLHRNKLYERLKTKVDYVVCISSYTKKTVHEKLHIPNERVFVIPISVHDRLDNPGTAKAGTILKKYNLDDKKYCIYPANLWPHKNHKMLLLAYGRFVKLYPQCSLDLVLSGASIDRNSVITYSQSIGLSDRVHFIGYLSEEELAAVWAQAHFLIFPSLFEGFGIPLVEAMMYGKPILASNVTSIPEVAGSAALYFDPRKPDEIVEAMRQIMSDEGLYRRLVEEGQKQLGQYRYEEMVEKYLEVLHRAAEGGSVAEYAEVTGIYPDCWAGEQIEVGLGAGKGKRVLTLRGYIPEWHPAREVKLKITLPDGRKKSYVVHRDEELKVSENLPEQAGITKIAVSGGSQINDVEKRKLTFIVQEALIFDEGLGKEVYKFDGISKESLLLKNRELYQHILELGKQLRESEGDRRARLEKINELIKLLQESETDRAARLEQIEELGTRLEAVDRESRLRHEEIKKLESWLKESDADRAARLKKIEELGARLDEVDRENSRRYEQIEDLTGKLQESERDRAARLVKIEELGARLDAVDRESRLRHEEIMKLESLLKESEADRAARLEKMEELSKRIEVKDLLVQERDEQIGQIKSTRAYRLLKKMHIMP